jgi:hypothetical protein
MEGVKVGRWDCEGGQKKGTNRRGHTHSKGCLVTLGPRYSVAIYRSNRRASTCIVGPSVLKGILIHKGGYEGNTGLQRFVSLISVYYLRCNYI